jgi:hypothetical protein
MQQLSYPDRSIDETKHPRLSNEAAASSTVFEEAA